MNISMKEAAVAWGSGKEVEWQDARQLWNSITNNGFMFNPYVAYRIKPEVTTSLHDLQLRQVYYSILGLPDAGYARSGINDAFNNALRAVADAAIKQYIKDQSSDKEQSK